jgi:pimeloyl-ACP methyl ester carboxylesterase
VLIGSSLGGYVAALCAARDRDLAAVVLLAPAFDFARRLAARVPEESRGRDLEVFHFATNRSERLGWGLVEDGLAQDPLPDVRCPALVLHGRHDESVPLELSEKFCAGRPNARLVTLDDDHRLFAATGAMWDEMRLFLAPFLPRRTDGIRA